MDRVDGPVSVVVSVADGHLGDLAGVIVGLRRAGLRVDGVLDAVGMVTGTIAGSAVDTLASVPGVVQVERQHLHSIAPPDSEIQ